MCTKTGTPRIISQLKMVTSVIFSAILFSILPVTHAYYGQDQLHLDMLAERLEGLKYLTDVKFREIEHANKTVQWLTMALDKLELVGECEPGQFQCGGQHPKCIPSMLLCDKSYDCPNGMDEDSELCAHPVPVGSAWTGVVDSSVCDWPVCQHVTLAISRVQTISWMPSRADMSAVLLKSGPDCPEKQRLLLTGDYNYAMHDMALMNDVTDDVRITVTCLVARGHVSSLTCKIGIRGDDVVTECPTVLTKTKLNEIRETNYL